MASPTSWTSSFFFFNDTATTEIYTLSLHDALPIFGLLATEIAVTMTDKVLKTGIGAFFFVIALVLDRKSTRLNSSHSQISYAVFCLKKKKTILFKISFYLCVILHCHGIAADCSNLP